ncbi:MAG: PAS domain S-box protein [Acidimicrobiales bacterium]
MTRSRPSDARFLLALLMVSWFIGSASTIILLVRTADVAARSRADSVAVNLVGRQRLLVERINGDRLHLQVDPDTPEVRRDLGTAADELDTIRRGFMRSDPRAGFVGDVAAPLQEMYAVDLNLDHRLELYSAAARELAGGADPAESPAATLIEAEATEPILVGDLDQVIHAITTTNLRTSDRSDTWIMVTIGFVATVGVLSAVVMMLLIRQVIRQQDENASLIDGLEASESLYRETLDSIVDAVVVQDEEGTVLRVNRAARDLFRLTSGGHVPEPGEPYRHLLPPLLDANGGPVPDHLRPVVRVLRGEPEVRGLVVGVDLADGVRWMRLNVSVLHQRDGARMAVVSFAEITDERKVAAELTAERTRYRMMIAHAPIGHALLSADGVFIEVNPAFCELTERSRDDLLGRRFVDITHPDDVEMDRATVRSLLEGRADSFTTEKRYVSPDGRPIDVQLAVAIVRPEGAEPYFIAQVVDIRDRKRAERAQLEALNQQRNVMVKLEDLDRTRNNFVSTISHELRTPMTSIIGYLELLADDGDGFSRPQISMIEAISRNSHRLLRLIEDLLIISEIEDHRFSLDWTEINVENLIDRVIDSVADQVGRTELTVTADVRLDGRSIRGDVHLLQRVLANIVGNAVKFTPPGGRVEISARMDEQRRDRVAIAVADTGVGIPLEDQAGLFTRFHRSASAHLNAVPGTGLGLAIAADLVRAHEGEISVDSTTGVGTTVTVVLPAAERRAPLGADDALEAVEADATTPRSGV